MNRKVREPFLAARIVNMILGFVILGLILPVIYGKGNTEFLELLIFALAAVENFVVATISFSEQRRLRGNIYAVICAAFLIVTVILGVRYFIVV